MRLALHLENQQSVVFRDDADIEGVLSIEKHSTLTGWFLAKQKFPSARESLTYVFLNIFVCDKTKREWKPRVKRVKHCTMTDRAYSVHPSEGERFYLRILLNHVTALLAFMLFVLFGRMCLWYIQGPFGRLGIINLSVVPVIIGVQIFPISSHFRFIKLLNLILLFQLVIIILNQLVKILLYCFNLR